MLLLFWSSAGPAAAAPSITLSLAPVAKVSLFTAQATPSIRLSLLAVANPFGTASPSITLTLGPVLGRQPARATPSIALALAPVSRVTAFAVVTPRITLAMGTSASQTALAHAAPSIRLTIETHSIGGFIPAGSTVIELEYNASGTTLTGSQEITFREGGVSTLTLSQRE